MFFGYFKNLCSEYDIMYGQSVAVLDNTLLVRRPAGVAACKHFADLIVIPELVEIAEAADVFGVIAQDAVKNCVTVHEPLCMDGDERCSWRKTVGVFHNVAGSVGNTAEENVGSLSQFIDVIGTSEADIPVSLKAFAEIILVMFVSEQLDVEYLPGFLFQQACQDGSGRIAQPHDTIVLCPLLAQDLRCCSCQGTGAHGSNPVSIRQCQQFARLGIIQEQLAA